MPRPRPWADQAQKIRATLERWEHSLKAVGFTPNPLSAREVQELFGIGRSAAYDLMNEAGGAAGFVGVDDLLRLLRSPETQMAAEDATRRVGETVLLPVTPDTLATFQGEIGELPVRFEGDEFIVKFTSALDLAETLFAVGQAMLRNWPLFQKLCGEDSKEEAS